MDASPLNHQIKGLLLAATALAVAAYAGYIIGSESYWSLILGTVFVGAACLWFFSGKFFWVLTIASSFLTGTFPILQGQFTPFHLLMVMGLAKFLIEDVIMNRVRLKMPGRFDLFMIVGFMSVILYHGMKDRFGMSFFGSAVWGGRYYVSVFAGLVAFFVIQSIPMKRGMWAKFPYVVLAISGFDFAINIITMLVPSTIYFIFPFYSAVSNSGIQELVGGPIDAVGRMGAVGNFGVMITLVVLSKTSMRHLLHPENFFRWVSLTFAGACTLLAGYRSTIINTIVIVAFACIRDLRYAALAAIPALAAVLFSLSIINSEVIALPKQIQRSLSFVPGHWDYEMARDAQGSNDFRATVWKLWWHQYFPLHPVIGRGFGFRAEWTKKSIYWGDGIDYQQMVETGNIHNGLFAALDTFGLLGTLFFVTWNISILKRILRVPFDGQRGEHLTLRFLALYQGAAIICYWGGVLSPGSFLPTEFALVSLFLRLLHDLDPVDSGRRRGKVPAGRRKSPRELAPA